MHYFLVKLNCFILRTTTVAGLGVPIFRVFTVHCQVTWVILGAVRKSMIGPYSQIRDIYLFKAGWLFGKMNIT